MVTGIEILVLAVVLVLVLGISVLVEAVRPLIVNAAVGLLGLFLAQWLLGISLSVGPLALAIVALGGLPGAVLVVVLSVFGVAF
ncbi:hypothetical protein OB905_07295 [Halobacteria archaeon AArc-dxtr1]|nr:hypothetical protein [Halobacteria archaeon AArc-dxtr1]